VLAEGSWVGPGEVEDRLDGVAHAHGGVYDGSTLPEAGLPRA